MNSTGHLMRNLLCIGDGNVEYIEVVDERSKFMYDIHVVVHPAHYFRIPGRRHVSE
jgi:hypothetical protein